MTGNAAAPANTIKAANLAEEITKTTRTLSEVDLKTFVNISDDLASNAKTLIDKGEFTAEQLAEIKKTATFVREDLARSGKTIGTGEQIAAGGKWLSQFEGLGLTDDLAKRLSKKFDDLGFSEAQVDGFVSDIAKGGDGFVSAIGKNEELVDAWKVIKYSGDDDLAKLATNLDELDLVSKNLDEIEAARGYKAWKTSRTITSVKKLTSSSSSVNISWKNLDDKNLIWASPNGNKLSTAKYFANETGTSLFDAVLDGTYVKIDINDGRILLGNTDGSYQAFAVLNDADLGAFKSSVLNVSEDVFNAKLSDLMAESSKKLKVLSGANSKTITIAGKSISLSSNKVNTFLGRFRPDIRNLFDEFGSFKNVGLGETPGGINLLNKPDHYYDASTWWDVYNKPWLNKAIDRGDEIYLATVPQKADDVIDATGNLKGAFAEELNHLVSRNYKPSNITDSEWGAIKSWFTKD